MSYRHIIHISKRISNWITIWQPYCAQHSKELGVGTYGRVGETSEKSFDFDNPSSYKRGLYFGMYKPTYTSGRPQSDNSDGVFFTCIHFDGNAPLGFVLASASYGDTWYYKKMWNSSGSGWVKLV